MDTNQTNQEAKKEDFLITEDLYYRQLTKTSSIIIEQEADNRYICYRIQWEGKPAGNHYSIKEEKFYCRGSWRRCLNKAKSIIEFYEKNVFKKKVS